MKNAGETQAGYDRDKRLGQANRKKSGVHYTPPRLADFFGRANHPCCSSVSKEMAIAPDHSGSGVW